jgi:hypothetical protein
VATQIIAVEVKVGDVARAGGIISAAGLPIGAASNMMVVKIQATTIITAMDNREI